MGTAEGGICLVSHKDLRSGGVEVNQPLLGSRRPILPTGGLRQTGHYHVCDSGLL